MRGMHRPQNGTCGVTQGTQRSRSGASLVAAKRGQLANVRIVARLSRIVRFLRGSAHCDDALGRGTRVSR